MKMYGLDSVASKIIYIGGGVLVFFSALVFTCGMVCGVVCYVGGAIKECPGFALCAVAAAYVGISTIMEIVDMIRREKKVRTLIELHEEWKEEASTI